MAAHQAPPTLGFSRQEHWSTGVGCHFLLQCMKVKVKVKSLSHVWLLATPWTAAHQAPPSMRFSRQECWSGVPFPDPRQLLIYLSILDTSWINRIIVCVVFSFRICFHISFMLWYVLVLYSFLLLDNIPLYGCTVFYLPIHELVDI